MRLKKLILHGFKSFADRTEFVFDSPITGIVGPNGCGKSNVVDGFKWVLGEQSAKSLRGEAMLDVIFNGSGGRKPAGMAEVVLVFDNPKRDDGSRVLNLDLDEVGVGRRLYRDGTSEYHINNQTSRLKDIRELFLDTGVGVDAYSVIEQGRVAALLEANPAERRLIFEEAAGISKFKARKKEAQRKLEKVDQNLLRVNDIVEEVEKRLRSVRIQAGRARTYQEYSTRLGELRLTYALQDYHAQRTKLDELVSKQEDAQFRLDDASADLARRQNELATKRGQFEELSRKRQQVEYELVQAKAAMQSARQRQEYAAQQLEQIAEQVTRFTRDREDAAAKLEEVSQSLEEETQALQQLTAELEQRRRTIDEKQQQFREGQLRLNALNQQIEQHKASILELMRKLATLNSRIGGIEIERKNIAAQQQRLGERRRVVLEEIGALETQRAEAQAKLDETLANLAELQKKLESRREQASHLGKQIAAVSDNLAAAREHRSGLLSRQKLLKDLEARREGVSEGVKSVLRQREQKYPFIRGLVADLLRVDVEFAHVIEAALDGRDQWLIADDFAALTSSSRELFDELEGRVNILCVDQLRCWEFMPFTSRYVVIPKALQQLRDLPSGTKETTISVVEDGYYDWNQHRRRVRMALDLARFDSEGELIVRHLLGRTLVVDDLAAALDLRRSGPSGFRFVTHGGEVLEADGTLRAGPLTAAMGIISRRSELEQITQQIGEVDERVGALSAQLTEGNAAARTLEQQQKALTDEIYKASTLKVELTSRIAQNGDKQASLRREEPLLDRELANLLAQVEKLGAEEGGLVAQRQAMDAEQQGHQQKVEESTATQQALAEELKHTGEELTAARVEIGQVQEKQIAAQQHAQRQAVAKNELMQQVERLTRAADAAAAKRGGIEEELELAREAEAELAEKQETLSGQLESLAGTVGELGEAVGALTGQVETFRASHAEIEQQLHALDKQSGETRVRLETLVQRTLDELQLNLPEKYDALHAPQEDGTPGPGYQPADMDWDAVAEEIKELREKIHRLGNVNLDSLGELDELEKREEFMRTQVTDLTESKKQLEELIDKINAESGLRFEQTFTAVREHFQTMFRKLFGGGKADVYLETEVEEKGSGFRARGSGADGSSLNPEPGTLNPPKKIDPLEAGIEIMAHPPGKKPVTISQLSGGEKTMTCVALLMSIFKSKPSPFCILDEVDAALDEANNQRFNLIVQEFLEQSQFIVITHSKRTMQIADVLYGVTMQEQGVSKRVAVKFDQVDSQGRISEQAAA